MGIVFSVNTECIWDVGFCDTVEKTDVVYKIINYPNEE